VVGEGNLILTNEDIGKPVYLETSGKPRCKVDYQAPEKFNPEIPYEEAAATCA
jgi:outer membrane usher protein